MPENINNFHEISTSNYYYYFLLNMYKFPCIIIINNPFVSRYTFLQVLTKDSVTVSVDAVVYYRVSNATVSIANVENAHHSTRLLAQTTLRNTMGTRHLHEILSERQTISGTMQVMISHSLHIDKNNN